MKIDTADAQILNELQANSRITNRELAQRVGISPSPTLECVKKLEREGVIEKYVTLVNPKAVGFGTFTFVQVTLMRHGQQSILSFIDSVNAMEEVMECYHVTGTADFVLKVTTRDIEAYETFVVQKLTEIPGVQQLHTMVILSTIKHKTQLPIQPTEESK